MAMAVGSALAASALLMGCASQPEPHELNSPSADEAVDDPSPELPKYTTDLQLSEEEKKAVDEALAVLERYIEVTNEVFGNGGEGAEQFEDVAKDATLISTQSDAADLRSKDAAMVGEFGVNEIKIHELELARSEVPVPYVSVHACVPTHEYRFTDHDDDSDSEDSDDVVTFEFIIANYDDGWFVSEQYLWAEECDV
ncbi:hypothetical protein GCM10022261_14070 [Brevibacterium daeguense]|uniref:Lipoprotein n=2 Tax=Brevibacterium daeguense TaxID=909936 RepID=A0ABP8EJ04_9MICO